MPAGVRHELGGIVRMRVHGILTAHFHVTAQRDRADAVVGIAPAKAKKPFTESNRENLHPDPEPLGHRVMAELVDQDHETQDNRDSDDGDQKIRHKN